MSLFSKIFGDKSQEQAELLLVKALKKESECVVRDEISWRYCFEEVSAEKMFGL